MAREMRRKDRQLGETDIKELLHKAAYGVLSLVDANNQAYGVPLSFVYFRDALYFHSATEGLKLDLMRQTSRAAFCIVGDTVVLPEQFTTNYESVIALGKAIEVTDEEKKAALEAFVEKYASAFKEKGLDYIEKAGSATTVVKLCIEQCTGKARR